MALDSVKLWRLFLISTFWPLILLTSCRQPFIYGIYGQLLRLRYSLKSLWFLLVKVGLVACFACLTVQTATGNSLRLQSLLYWVYCINCSFGHLPSVAPASLFCRPTGDYGRNIPSCIAYTTSISFAAHSHLCRCRLIDYFSAWRHLANTFKNKQV